MKINDIKHNHSLTDLLKVSIFSILMCAPLIAIGSICLYTIVNKNAYLSYSNYNADNTKYENVNTFNNFVEGRSYLFLSDNNTTNLQNSMANSLIMNVSNVSVKSANVGTNTIDLIEQANIIRLWRDSGNNWIRFYENNTSLTSSSFSSLNLNFTFTLVNYSNANSQLEFNNYSGNMFYKSEVINTTNTLDNAFYYATEKMTQSDLFNWTQNTAIYTGVNQMTTQLGINTQVIPILLVYWFILIIVYVIIDIVLKCFTTLTHMLSKETH